MEFRTSAANLVVDEEGTVSLWSGFYRLTLTRRQATELYKALGDAIAYSAKVAP